MQLSKKTNLFLWLAVLAAFIIVLWLMSPLFINKKVSEDVPSQGNVNSGANNNINTSNGETNSNGNESQAEYLASGNFEGQAGHRGAGTASLITVGDKYYIRMEEDFDIINGPDLFVHLGRNEQYDPNVNLGALKGNIGSQNYEVSDSEILKTHNEVWVWCRAFSVPFARAVLNYEVSGGEISGGTINLSGRGLTEFPKDILAKNLIKKLDLSNNNLKTLPAEIGELTKLEELYLNNNNLEGSLVAEIRKMPNLRILDASNNNMTGIPAEIGQLGNLETVNFSNNNLDTMPNEIENLKDNLKKLDLSGNRYSSEMISEIKNKLPNTEVIY